jgi:site-specific recombinase XerD
MRKENVLPTIRVEMRNEKDLNAKGETSLRYVIRLLGEGKVCKATGFTVKPNLWDKKTRKALGNSEESKLLNRAIALKIVEFENYFDGMRAMKRRITLKSVNDFFHDKRWDSFFGYFDSVLAERKSVNEKSTCVKDNVCRNRLEEFAISEGYRNLKFVDITLEFLKGFDKFLIRKLGMQSNSADNYHKVLKVVLKEAIVGGIIDRNPYLGFKPLLTGKGAPKAILSSEEVNALRMLTFESEEVKYLEKTRDVFLFMLNTGLRFSDVKNAFVENLNSLEKGKHVFLNVVQKKTKNAVEIYLNREARLMIHRVRGKQAIKDERLFRNLTLQPFNRNLKELAKMIGSEKELSSHVARHSLATFLYNFRGLSYATIGEILGHKNSSVTDGYVRKSCVAYAEFLTDLYPAIEVEEEFGKRA